MVKFIFCYKISHDRSFYAGSAPGGKLVTLKWLPYPKLKERIHIQQNFLLSSQRPLKGNKVTKFK